MACAGAPPGYSKPTDHQFRHVNDRLHLLKLRTAPEEHFSRNVSAICQDETVNAP